jgi:hypothetical protein
MNQNGDWTIPWGEWIRGSALTPKDATPPPPPPTTAQTIPAPGP